MTLAQLHVLLAPYLLQELVLKSRIHPLHSYCRPSSRRQIWIKRDDELSAGITGSKYRKYASLIKHILEEQYDEVILIGGSQSNNIAGMLQLLIEHKVVYRLMLLKSHDVRLNGNSLWINLLTGSKDVITWIDRENWPDVNKIAESYKKELQNKGVKALIVSEGGAMPEAIAGAMTLGLDIADYESDHSLSFDHIFIDSGTGTTASGLLLAMAALRRSLSNIHITLIAGTGYEFLNQFKAFYDWAYQKFSLANTQNDFHFHKPLLAPSFGSVNQKVLEEVKRMAISEGILMDPVYSIKHFYTSAQVIEENEMEGNILIVYSGGALGLTGFQDRLAL